MRFSLDHRFDCTVARMEALLEDPDLYPRMQRSLPGMERIELLSQEESDGVLRRRVRYTPRAEEKIPSFGRGIITPEMLIWTEHSAFHRAAHRIDYRIEPNLPGKWKDRFESTGSFLYRAAGHGVERTIEGEVIVHVPLLGKIVERMLVKELTHSFSIESEVLTAWLAEGV
jgi:hypothetical protein